jgi:hypothetical protein
MFSLVNVNMMTFMKIVYLKKNVLAFSKILKNVTYNMFGFAASIIDFD